MNTIISSFLQIATLAAKNEEGTEISPLMFVCIVVCFIFIEVLYHRYFSTVYFGSQGCITEIVVCAIISIVLGMIIYKLLAAVIKIVIAVLVVLIILYIISIIKNKNSNNGNGDGNNDNNGSIQ